MNKSKVYEQDGKLFRYNYDDAVVEYVYKATEEDKAEEAEWLEKHGCSLHHIDSDGYAVITSIGLRRDNWDHEELRREYIAQWIADLDEELRALTADFERYELPILMKSEEGQLNSYYYTFGSDPGFPYRNGWVVVKASSREEADRKFRSRFPDRPGHEGTMNYSFCYTKERWNQMDPEHTWTGWKLYEVIE
nr:hypothetical protein [uncultured Oscillibacter sp.]